MDDEILTHYGVLGMKWGRRKERLSRAGKGISKGGKQLLKEGKKVARSKIGRMAIAGVLATGLTYAAGRAMNKALYKRSLNQVTEAIIKLELERQRRNTIYL